MPLRRSTRERRNVIPDDYIVFLQEHEGTDGMIEGDPSTSIQSCRILTLKIE